MVKVDVLVIKFQQEFNSTFITLLKILIQQLKI